MGFPLLLLLTMLFLLLQPFSSIANLHKLNTLFKSNLSEQVKVNHELEDETPPTIFFEVTKPIKVPHTQPCTHPVLQHTFGYPSHMKQPTVHAAYNPPSEKNCPSRDFSKIVFEWTATCKSRQIGKIFGVWLGGVELLRGCTAEPIPNEPNGIIWTVKKDITKYYSLLMKTESQILSIFLDNIVDETYTGVYDVTITIHFYPVEDRTPNIPAMAGHADLILPISENMQPNEGFWFRINEDTRVQSKYTVIPQNVYKAVLEIYVSFHESDEYWYANPPQDYIKDNDITGMPGNGPFREVIVSIDGRLVGAVWPFTVIYTGGVNSVLWKPITGIGSFDLPSYDIDITHYLGTMLDGEMHKISFRVTDALNVWFIDANLHLWLDHNSKKTTVKLLTPHELSHLKLTHKPDFNGLDGTSVIEATRLIFSIGSVESSYGLISSNLSQEFKYSNSMILENDGNWRKVKQYIHLHQKAYEENPTSNAPRLTEYSKEFEILIETNNEGQEEDGTHVFESKLKLSIEERKSIDDSHSSLQNQQIALGTKSFKGDNTVVGALGDTQQEYDIRSSDSCYSRSVHSKDYVILRDEVDVDCTNN